MRSLLCLLSVRGLRVLVAASVFALGASSLGAQEAVPAPLNLEQAWARHERAVAAARSGDTLRAVAELEALARAFPATERFAQDWLVVLTWLGRDSEALEVLSRIDPEAAPAYVLEALAGAARRTGDLPRARTFLAQTVARFPAQTSSRTALAWVLFDLGRVAEGEAVLDGLPSGRERDLARARYAEARGEWTAALALWSDLLALNPDDREANVGMVGAARRLGAVHVADEIIQQHPDWFDVSERTDVLADRVAQELRWSLTTVAQGAGPERFAELDRALAASDELERRLRAGGLDLQEGEWRMLLDRCAMLVERFRMQEALDLHARLTERLKALTGRALPPYVEAAIGEALLYLDRPEEAEPRFRQALAAGGTAEARFGLFYALEDAGRHDEALKWIDGLVDALRPAEGRANPSDADWVRARVLAASVRSWHNDPERAERDLRELLYERPGDAGVRQALAEVLRARGWPREALQVYEALVAEEPDSFGVRVDRAENLLGLYHWAAAGREVESLGARRPEDRQVQKLAESWARSQAPELTMEFSAGSGSTNAPAGSRDWALESRLYSRPFEENWRGFAHGRLAEGFVNGNGSRVERIGMGLDYRSPDLRGGLLFDASPLEDQSPAFSGNLRWWADDRYWAGAALATRVPDLPVQARLAGVHASRVGLDAGVQLNEQRSFSVGTARLQYSDTNERRIYTAAWDQRLMAGPRARLDLRLSLWQSYNTFTGAAYFNPGRDFAPTATLAAEWTSWRLPLRSFSQRVSASAGRYYQTGVTPGPIWELQYEHVWDWNGWQSLRYGVGRALHPYDGVQANRNFLNVSIMARF